MKKGKHRYSFLIMPGIFVLDILILSCFGFKTFRTGLALSLFLIVYWFALAFFTGYYRLYRYSVYNDLLSKYFRHIFLYNISLLALMKFFPVALSGKELIYALLLMDLLFFLEKTFIFVILKKYRSRGYNIRHYVIFGYNEEIETFQKFLDKRSDYGYRFSGYFADNNKAHPLRKGGFEEGIRLIKENPKDIDVIFVSLREFDDGRLEQLNKLAAEHFIKIKYIPDNTNLFKKKLIVEYFEYYPVLSPQKSPLDEPFNAFVKRLFDIVFSLFVIVVFLSWITPILALLIKLESKGPVFFKQKRNGRNFEEFTCLKFRSMVPNRYADIKQVSKNDKRVTKIGKFLRKTSIDELPQFFNVLKGDMSVVGPRPHMVKENHRFKEMVENFQERHYVLPGITGLSQVKGYRGEVLSPEDIINRVKYDVYYIENWSLWLDLKIILQTVLNIFKGDQKAY